MLANERGRARHAQAGAEAPVLADEQWAAPAEHATYHRTFDQTNRIQSEHNLRGMINSGQGAWSMTPEPDERTSGWLKGDAHGQDFGRFALM